MHLGSMDNVHGGSFHIYWKKTIFHFSSAKNGFFCEAATTNMLQK
jgi:hypothetical protein